MIQLLNDIIDNAENSGNFMLKSDALSKLALISLKLSGFEQIRNNLKDASESMDKALALVTKEIDPIKNAKIHRMIGDIYYLQSQVPRKHNEAGPRYVQRMVSFEAKAKSAYRKAEQMGIFEDMISGIKLLKSKDAKNVKRKSNNSESSPNKVDDK